MPVPRRHLLASAAATAACAAMPAAGAIAAVETAPATFDLFPWKNYRFATKAEILAILDDPTWLRPPSADEYVLDDLDDGRRIR